MWKKRKAIEGVSASSMVALKATLFEEEQRSKLQGKAQPTEKKAKVGLAVRVGCAHNSKVKSLRDALGVSNKGLAERLARDEQQKAPADMTPEDIERRLREKAELYHRIKRGEVDVNDDDDERGYLVDFVKKGYLEQEEEDSRDRRGPDGSLPLYMQSEDVRREQDRQAWERSVQQGALRSCVCVSASAPVFCAYLCRKCVCVCLSFWVCVSVSVSMRVSVCVCVSVCVSQLTRAAQRRRRTSASGRASLWSSKYGSRRCGAAPRPRSSSGGASA